jgi:hypothetical protein
MLPGTFAGKPPIIIPERASWNLSRKASRELRDMCPGMFPGRLIIKLPTRPPGRPAAKLPGRLSGRGLPGMITGRRNTCNYQIPADPIVATIRFPRAR